MKEVASPVCSKPSHARDSKAFSAIELESDNELSVHQNHQSNHDTPDEPEDNESKHTPIPKSMS